MPFRLSFSSLDCFIDLSAITTDRVIISFSDINTVFIYAFLIQFKIQLIFVGTLHGRNAVFISLMQYIAVRFFQTKRIWLNRYVLLFHFKWGTLDLSKMCSSQTCTSLLSLGTKWTVFFSASHTKFDKNLKTILAITASCGWFIESHLKVRLENMSAALIQTVFSTGNVHYEFKNFFSNYFVTTSTTSGQDGLAKFHSSAPLNHTLKPVRYISWAKITKYLFPCTLLGILTHRRRLDRCQRSSETFYVPKICWVLPMLSLRY